MPGTASTISSTSTCARLLRVQPPPNLWARQSRIEPKKLNTHLLRSGHSSGKFVFPARNHHASDAISKNRYGGAAHVHELINREQQKKWFHGQVKRSGSCKDNQEGSPGHPGGSFTAQEKRQNHYGLLAEREMHARRLRDKNERERLIEARAVHIEAVARGQNERDDLPRNAKRFQFLHGDGQSGFRAGGGKAQRDGFRRNTHKRLQRN